jgi:hypothetical protein
MAQPMPKVRSACEACHKRKQRCILPESGGACHACRQYARHCFFVPRIRPGKQPRRNTLDRSDLVATKDSSGASGLNDAMSPLSSAPSAGFEGFVLEDPQPQPGPEVDDDQTTQDLDSFWDAGFVLTRGSSLMSAGILTEASRFEFAMHHGGFGMASPLPTPNEPPRPKEARKPPGFFQAPPAATMVPPTTPATTMAHCFIELDAQRQLLQEPVNDRERTHDAKSSISSALQLLAYVPSHSCSYAPRGAAYVQ